MDIVCIDPKTDRRWQQLLDRYGGSVFHSPAWIRALADTYDLDIRARVLADGSGEPRAGVPFCRISDLQGERIVVLPFSDYCDPLVADDASWRRLVDSLLEPRLPITVRCLHNHLPLADERFTLAKRSKWHGIDLRPDLDTIRRNFSPSVRQWVRKAQRAGVAVRLARGEEDLRAFFLLHLQTRKRKHRLLAQPYRFFENVWRQFSCSDEYARLLLVAHYQDQVIGGTLFLGWKDTLFYKFNASDPAHLSLRPNDLIVWEGTALAKAKGFAWLDFGLSDWDQEGLVRFKRKFATDERTISAVRHTPDRAPTRSEQDAQDVLSAATDLLTDAAVPDDVTERAGDLLYRFFA